MKEASETARALFKLRYLAAVSLCIVHLLSVCGMAYQSPLKADYFTLVNFSVWLMPAALPLLIQRSTVLLLIVAIPIVSIFCARLYFAAQLYSTGWNSIGQKGDAAWLATTVMGALSIGVVALWLLTRVVFFIGKRAVGASKNSDRANE